MTKLPLTNGTPAIRRRYVRPLKVSIGLCVLGEAIIFLVWGVLLFPGGSWLHKFLWAVIFCGLGMGATVGAALDLLVVDRYEGRQAELATGAIFLTVLGVVCNLLFTGRGKTVLSSLGI